MKKRVSIKPSVHDRITWRRAVAVALHGTCDIWASRGIHELRQRLVLRHRYRLRPATQVACQPIVNPKPLSPTRLLLSWEPSDILLNELCSFRALPLFFCQRICFDVFYHAGPVSLR